MAVLTGVKTNMLEIYLPRIFPTMTEPDMLTLKQWYIRENDVVQPADLLLEVEAPIGDIAILAPPEMTIPHRVIYIAKAQGAPVKLGDFLISLEPEMLR